MTDRRAFLTAALIAPVAIAMPAVAATGHSIEAMIAEYWRIMGEYERHPVHETFQTDPDYARIDQSGEEIHKRALAVQQRALLTPSRSGRDISLKLDMILKDYKDCELPDDLIKIIADDARRLA